MQKNCSTSEFRAARCSLSLSGVSTGSRHAKGGFFGPGRLLAVVLSTWIVYLLVAGTSAATASKLGLLGHEPLPKPSPQRTLTFAQRVAYQRAIEDVYWRHRIWPKENVDREPSLDAVMTQAQLERKIVDYLRNSQALEDYWQRPITADQLQAEMERMAQHTKQPEVLRELFAALRNDPFVIAECLARPALADRLLCDQTAVARRSEGAPEQRAEAELLAHATVIAPEGDRLESRAARAGNELPIAMATSSGEYTLPNVSEAVECTFNTWTATNTTNAPSGRAFHSAVWTGSEMIVWGGQNGNHVFHNGARYNPRTDTWTSITAPGALTGGRAVWSGTEMIVWDGGSGGRYNPVTNTWRSVSPTNAPSYRGNHSVVWTGREMIVWGGVDPFGFALNTGGRYNPNTNSWAPTTTTNAPAARSQQTAVWTGSEMIIWGGLDYFGAYGLRTGGGYDPIRIAGWLPALPTRPVTGTSTRQFGPAAK